jgi:serine/threonine protein kinase
MEFLTGKSLDEWLRPDRRASIPETLTIGCQIAKGLSAAHAIGLVHRDIKPANLWLEVPPGRVKILDFGLARHIAGELTQLTTTGALLGTPAFMAPEQARGEETDQRCDLFSFGCVLYRMVTGRLPFQGNTVYAVLQAVASETPPAPCHINPAVPPRLAALIAALLEKNPDRRPASAEAVLGELLDIGNDSKSMSYVNAKHPQSNPKGGGSAARAHQNVVASIAPPIPEREPARRSVWVLSTLAIATLVMCALTIAIAIALRPKPGGPGPSPVAGSGQTTPPRSPDDGDATKRLAPDPAPSPVGTWDVTYRNGNTVVMIVAGDHTAIVDNGFRGQWEQTGHKVVLIETNNPPGTKPLRWDLEIDATGNGSRARIVPAARQQASRERAIEPTRIVHKGTYL